MSGATEFYKIGQHSRGKLKFRLAAHFSTPDAENISVESELI